MALVSVNKRKAQGQAWSADLTVDGRTYVDTWIVEFDAVPDTPQAAALAAGLPDFGDAYPDDGASYVRSKVANPLAQHAGKQFDVVITYSTVPDHDPDSPIGPTDNPANAPPEVAWVFDEKTVAIHTDIFGNTIKNSAGDLFDPAVEVEHSLLQANITLNWFGFNATYAQDMQGSVNQYPTWIAGYYALARWARVKLSTSIKYWTDPNTGARTVYWPVQYEVTFNPDTWDRFILDQGFYERIDGKLRRIQRSGQDVDTPQRLGGSGQVLNDASPNQYRIAQVYEQRPFDGLGLNI